MDIWTYGWIERIVGGENLLLWFNQATVSMWNSILYIFDPAYCMSWCLWWMWKGAEDCSAPFTKAHQRFPWEFILGLGETLTFFKGCENKTLCPSIHTCTSREKPDSHWLLRDCGFGYKSLECFLSKEVSCSRSQ